MLLLAVYAFFFASTNLFYHTHNLENSKIVHSHPWGGHDHSHTAGQIQLIQAISQAEFKSSGLTSVPCEAPALLSVFNDLCAADFIPEFHFSSFSLRAPPISL